MDPVSAIGLASSVLTLAEFSWKLAAGVLEIFHSADGMTVQDMEIQSTTKQLYEVSECLEKGIPARTLAEERIKQLSKSCQQDSTRLLDLLEQITVPKGTGSKFRKAILSIKSSIQRLGKVKELENLKEQLSGYRSEILFNVNILLWCVSFVCFDALCTSLLTLSCLSPREDQSAFGKQLSTISQTCEDTNAMMTQVTSLRDTLANSIKGQNSATGSAEVSSIIKQLQSLQSTVKAIPVQQRILDHLVFNRMDSRQNQIHTADDGTCRWILDEEFKGDESDSASGTAATTSEQPNREGSVDQTRRDTRQSLINWLQIGKGVLHISGNPGSGKSTLMKFIANHGTTHQELRAWSGLQKLIFCQFYFWSPGGDYQRKMPGLIRSILFQALNEHPDLISEVFPKQFNLMKHRPGGTNVESARYFRERDMEDAFTLLLKQGQEKNYKFCFLIDGLDEADGNTLEHENLARKLRGWTSSPDIKVLVSSRPWKEFLRVFICNPTIHLHRLNTFDIQTYCSQQLCKVSSRCSQIWRQNTEETHWIVQSLVKEIANGAQGVFLWAHLVLDVVLLGIQHHSSLSAIQEEIRQYPVEIDELYDKLREPVAKNPSAKLRANRMLLLALHCPYSLFAIAFSWLEAEDGLSLVDRKFPGADDIQPYSEEDIEFRFTKASETMDRLTRGILELTVSGESSSEEDDFGKTFGRKKDDQIVDMIRRTQEKLSRNSFRRIKEDNFVKSFRRMKVKFCHRTARDYIMSRASGPDSDIRMSWKDFDETDVYGRLWLAYIVYGKVDEPNHSWFGEPDFFPPFCKEFHPSTIRRFEAPITKSLRPYWTGYQKSPNDDIQCSNSDISPSFIRYAAYCGLNLFVLDELHTQRIKSAKGPGLPSEPGILCCCLLKHNYDLAFAVLEEPSLINIDLNGPVMTRFLGIEDQVTLPEWVVALQLMFDRIYTSENESLRRSYEKVAQVVTRLLDHSTRAGKLFRPILCDEASPHGYLHSSPSGLDEGCLYKTLLCDYYLGATEDGNGSQQTPGIFRNRKSRRELESRIHAMDWPWQSRNESAGWYCGPGPRNPRWRLQMLELDGETIVWRNDSGLTRGIRVY